MLRALGRGAFASCGRSSTECWPGSHRAGTRRADTDRSSPGDSPAARSRPAKSARCPRRRPQERPRRRPERAPRSRRGRDRHSRASGAQPAARHAWPVAVRRYGARCCKPVPLTPHRRPITGVTSNSRGRRTENQAPANLRAPMPHGPRSTFERVSGQTRVLTDQRAAGEQAASLAASWCRRRLARAHAQTAWQMLADAAQLGVIRHGRPEA